LGKELDVSFSTEEAAIAFLLTTAKNIGRWGIRSLTWQGRVVTTSVPLGNVRVLVEAIERHKGSFGDSVAKAAAKPTARTTAGPSSTAGSAGKKGGLKAEEITATAARLLKAHPDDGRKPSAVAFGDKKVFIYAVWEELHRAGYRGALEDFKALLVELHRAREVSLSRADLVEAMDPRAVERSETRYLSGTYHFIRIE
jgi:hypothetical protein